MAESGFVDGLLGFIDNALRGIRELIREVIRGVLNFVQEVVDWFRKLGLIKGKDIPFVADPAKIKDMLNNAPVKNTGVFGLFEGVYDEQSDTITHHRLIEADSLDEQTRQILADAPLVVLS